jgi:hypothetical protein
VSNKTIVNLIKTVLVLFAVIVGVVLWYYTIGRKPKLALSAKFSIERMGEPVAHLVGPGEELLLLGNKVTLYNAANGEVKWSADLHVAAAPAAAAPAPATAAPRPAAAPAPAAPPPVAAAPGIKPDPLLAKRVEKKFAKLQTWAAKLNQKRTTLKTPLQIEAFNTEAAKYHSELAEARAEAAQLHGTQPAVAVALPARVEMEEAFARHRGYEDEAGNRRSDIIADGNTVWVLQGRHVFALDRASGHIVKDTPLAGEIADAYSGNGCLYVTVMSLDGVRQIARLTATDARVLPVTSPAGQGRFTWEAGQAPMPVLQPLRSEFRAAHSELLEADIRLVESKITEHQVMSMDGPSAMEEADKKTTGGLGNDAAVFAQALAKDTAREATGGKERIDESTYEVTLQRPFAVGDKPSAPVRVQGRPEIFSIATLDLVVAGQTLIAYDHTGQKRWESKLAEPLSFEEAPLELQPPNADTATSSRPCLEDGERLYLFDRAFLNTFERATGKLLWRIPSVGIRKVQLNRRGTIYVVSANGNADTLHGVSTTTIPLIIKANAKTGKIAWKLEKYEDCFVSGDDLYASRETRNGEDMVNQVFDRSKAPQTRFKLYKLSTRTGEPQWEWFQIRRPLSIESEGKKVSLLFADELQVIKSIAL